MLLTLLQISFKELYDLTQKHFQQKHYYQRKDLALSFEKHRFFNRIPIENIFRCWFHFELVHILTYQHQISSIAVFEEFYIHQPERQVSFLITRKLAHHPLLQNRKILEVLVMDMGKSRSKDLKEIELGRTTLGIGKRQELKPVKERQRHKSGSGGCLKVFKTRKRYSPVDIYAKESERLSKTLPLNASPEFTTKMSRTILHSEKIQGIAEICMEYRSHLKFCIKENEFVSNGYVLKRHQDALEKTKQSFPDLKNLEMYIQPDFDQFSEKAFAQNQKVLGVSYGVNTFKEFKSYIFQLCTRQKTEKSFFQHFVDTTVDHVIQQDIHIKAYNITEWVSSNFKTLQNGFNVTELNFRETVANLYSNGIASQEGRMGTVESINLRRICGQGLKFIEFYFKLYNCALKRTALFAKEVAQKMIEKYEIAIGTLVGNELWARNDLNRRHNQLKSYLANEFTDCLDIMIGTEYSAICEALFNNTDRIALPKKNQFLMTHTEDFCCFKLMTTFEMQIDSSLPQFLEQNKSNIQKCLGNCYKLVNSCSLRYDSFLVQKSLDVTLSPSNFSEIHKHHSEMTLIRLEREILEKYSINPDNFREACRSELENSFSFRLSEIEGRIVSNRPDESLDQQIPPKNETSKATPLTFAIDLNFSVISVAEIKNQVVEKIDEIPACMLMRKSGDISIGISAQNFVNRKMTDKYSTYFQLQDLLERDQVVEYHSCYIGGKLTKWKSYLILGLFLLKLKQDTERKFGGNWTEVGIAIPLSFTMGQRLAIKQAAEISGFKSCILINNTSAAVFELGLRNKSFKRSVANKYLIAVRTGNNLDVVSYVPDYSEKKSCYKIISSYCNIPITNTKNWRDDLKDKGLLTENDIFLINWTISCLEYKYKPEQNIRVWHAYTNGVKPNGIFLDNDYNTRSNCMEDIVSLGAAKIMHMGNSDARMTSPVRDIIPYKVMALTNSTTQNVLLQRNSCTPDKFVLGVRLLNSDTCAVTLAEICEKKYYVVGTLRVNRIPICPNGCITLETDGDGCVSMTPETVIPCMDYPNDVLKVRWTFREYQGCVPVWTKNQIEKARKLVETIDFQSVEDDNKENEIYLLLADTKTQIQKVTNKVYQKFITQAMLQLKSELESETATKDSIAVKHEHLKEVRKLFLQQ